MTTVSICITCYNYGRYVAEAVESALAQTHPDLDIVVVDDGSTDDSQAALAPYAGRITSIVQENSGQLRSARRAFEASRGDLVIFLDADDLLDPATAARVVAAYAAEPDAARIQWRLRVVGPHGEASNTTFPPSNWTMPSGDLRQHIFLRRTYVWPPTSGNAYPRRVIGKVFDALGNETPLIDSLLAETTPLLGTVVNLDGECGSYRWHGANYSGTSEMRQTATTFLHGRIEENLAIHRVVRRLCDQEGIPGCPTDPTEADDWAFASYRLSSLRVDPSTHPLPDDRRTTVAAKAIGSVLTQPDYAWSARAKRAAWCAVVAFAPEAIALRLIDRAYLTPPTGVAFTQTPVDQESAGRQQRE